MTGCYDRNRSVRFNFDHADFQVNRARISILSTRPPQMSDVDRAVGRGCENTPDDPVIRSMGMSAAVDRIDPSILATAVKVEPGMRHDYV